MKHSPLQVLRYIVPEVACSVNPKSDPKKPWENGIGELAINIAMARQPGPDDSVHLWNIELRVSQKLKEGVNFPYKFDVTLIGFFACKNGFPTPADEEQFVRVNGSSMLYGAARELVRSLTCRGPWGELFIPSISFYDKDSKPGAEEAASAAPTPETQKPN